MSQQVSHREEELQYGSTKGVSDKKDSVAAGSIDGQDQLPTIIVAGKPRNGKSKALNNIFDLDFASEVSCKSVTQHVLKKTVKKKGRELQIIDTPGLGAIDIPTKDITKEIKDAIEGIDYTLLYCLSVSPNSTLTEIDKTIVMNLHTSLGKVVWDKCVLLLTFSDNAIKEFMSEEEERSEDALEDMSKNPSERYTEFLKEYAEQFQSLLKTCGAHVSKVKTIFEYETQEAREEQTWKEIVAVPVGKLRTDSDKILPGIKFKDQEDWTDIAFTEMMKKTKEERRELFLSFKYDHVFPIGLGGLAVGAVIGTMFGPLGSIFGAGIGGAVSATAAHMNTTPEIAYKIKSSKKKHS